MEAQRPDSPEPSHVSLKSDQSKENIIGFKEGLHVDKGMEVHRPDSPEPSLVSLKSDQSKENIIGFKEGLHVGEGMEAQRPDSPEPSLVSLKSDRSKENIIGFKEGLHVGDRMEAQRPDSPEPSLVSLKSDQSKENIIGFKEGVNVGEGAQGPDSKDPSSLAMKSDKSREYPPSFKAEHPDDEWTDQEQTSDQSPEPHQTDLDSALQLVEKDLSRFMKNELKRVRRILCQNDQTCLETEEDFDDGDEEQKTIRYEFLNMVSHFLKIRKQEEMANSLQRRTVVAKCRQKIKSSLKRKFQCVSEGISKAGTPTVLNDIYTELWITEGDTGEVNDQHEVRQIETATRKTHRIETTIKRDDIFKSSLGCDKPIRTVMTKGVAGIGKTVLTKKLTLDWAEDKANQDIHFTFPFTFKELNLLKDKELSLVDLIHLFFPETKEAGISWFEKFKVVFIFDGLDECRFPLDFNSSKMTDVTQAASVGVLLTNLIRGNLLHSARLWVTTRPAAASQIPSEYTDMVTEVRGFTDQQKEEYFKKRFKDEQSSAFISHVSSSQSLSIMCHIPVFCWIVATVLEDELKTSSQKPKTLTEMYIHFLAVQSKLKNVKYDGAVETDPHWSSENKKIIESLGKLAFEQLEKDNLIFYESDLKDCGIDPKSASVCSGVFTQIFREERGLYQEKVFCFIHLSIQEFLAALHVHLTFTSSGVNLLSREQTGWTKLFGKNEDPTSIYRSAVDIALQRPNGHLDLFLRFFLGLSVESNESYTRGLLTPTKNSLQTKKKIVEYIKNKIGKTTSEKSINLFHCLNEMKESAQVEEIQKALKSESLSADKLTQADWSALAFVLLSSRENLDVFDLNKYSGSERALMRLLPVMKASNKALVYSCNLSDRSCKVLSSVIRSQSSDLIELDLSNNNLQDSGVKALCAGLKSPHCTLEKLSLSGCLITEEGCASLASALKSSSNLRELDLCYNHPGERGKELLSAILVDPDCKLETLRLEHCGPHRLRPDVRKYACEPELDTNTVSRELRLTNNDRTVTRVFDFEPYDDNPDRFEHFPQLLCTAGVTGRCYWEVEVWDRVVVAASYKKICRKGGDNNNKCVFGWNDHSWSLICHKDGYIVRHNNKEENLPPSTAVSNRVGVYADIPAGTLSFYSVSSDKLALLHTFNATFTEPLYLGLGPWSQKSSASLCSVSN